MLFFTVSPPGVLWMSSLPWGSTQSKDCPGSFLSRSIWGWGDVWAWQMLREIIAHAHTNICKQVCPRERSPHRSPLHPVDTHSFIFFNETADDTLSVTKLKLLLFFSHLMKMRNTFPISNIFRKLPWQTIFHGFFCINYIYYMFYYIIILSQNV